MAWIKPIWKARVLEMNKVGIMVDISHVTDSTFGKSSRFQKHLSSHLTACAGILHLDLERNMNDEMIEALGKTPWSHYDQFRI